MIEKIDGILPAAFLVRSIDQSGARAAEARPDSVPEKAAVAVVSTYDFQFRVDAETHEITAMIVDPETRAIIREIPAKEMHAASDVIRSLIGPLIDKIV